MRINATAFTAILLSAAATMLAGCDKERCEAVPSASGSPDQPAEVRRAAENSVRVAASNPDSVRFRGVQVWPQATKNQFAVCGQASVFGPGSNTYVLFVAIATRDEAGQETGRTLKVETRIGSTIAEATKVYVDTVARCYEGGGPQGLRREIATPMPPMPDDVKSVLAGPAAAPPSMPTVVGPTGQLPPATAVSPASGTVVMRQNGNIRIAPQGETIRVEPLGRELRVFGEAPGGWLQIGDSEATGWVHSSLVQRR